MNLRAVAATALLLAQRTGDHRGSGGLCAASLASVETRSERGAERIGALEPPDRWRWLSRIG